MVEQKSTWLDLRTAVRRWFGPKGSEVKPFGSIGTENWALHWPVQLVDKIELPIPECNFMAQETKSQVRQAWLNQINQYQNWP